MIEASSAADTPLPQTSATTTDKPLSVETTSKKSPPISVQGLLRDHALPLRHLRQVAQVGVHKLGAGSYRLVQDGVRNGGVFGERLALFVAPGSQTERAIFVAQENVTALGAREPQQRIYQRDQ